MGYKIRTFLNLLNMGVRDKDVPELAEQEVNGENETDGESGPLGRGTSETRTGEVGYPSRDDILGDLGVAFIIRSFPLFIPTP